MQNRLKGNFLGWTRETTFTRAKCFGPDAKLGSKVVWRATGPKFGGQILKSEPTTGFHHCKSQQNEGFSKPTADSHGLPDTSTITPSLVRYTRTTQTQASKLLQTSYSAL